MKPLTVVIPYSPDPFFEKTVHFLAKSDPVECLIIVSQEPTDFKIDGCNLLLAGPMVSQQTLNRILGEIQTKYLLLIPEARQISIKPEALEKILKKAESTIAGLIYSDFYDETEDAKTLHPLNDYQPGSVRDDFDFGAMILFSVPALQKTQKKYGLIPGTKFAGLYDLRLKLSIDHSFSHLKEPLYSVVWTERPRRSENLFDYVDPRNEAIQKEMEAVFTDYLKKIGAYLPSNHLKNVEEMPEVFPVEASVIIPVRNRRETIAEAVKSALSQETDFPFNVIVVDNHSTDGTTAILSNLARQHSNLRHIIPKRTDLGIGGCWNEALRQKECGRYAVQLDSDDLYSSSRTLQKMVDLLRQGHYAMVIGSYTLVDFTLTEIPPGLIDHREWTDENGHNNALRINGLGAPRAFNTDVMRKIRFLNVSYGEDYAAALRICREYRIGRIYESLYLCRRWPGNTDAAPSLREINQNNAFKDKIRTKEILARKKMAKGIGQRAESRGWSTTMRTVIRPWQKSDLASIRRIIWESWISTYSSFISESDLRSHFNLHYSEASLLSLFNDPSIQGLVAEADDQIAGFARISFNRDENHLYVSSLYLLPEFQGQEIGRAVLEAAERYAGERAFDELWIGVMVKNRPALLFYRRAGFVFVREEPFTMGKTTISHLIGYKKLKGNILINQKVHSTFDGREGLSKLCLKLLAEQKETWSDLRKGCESLKEVRERDLPCAGFAVRLQYNPGRIKSSTANVSGKDRDEGGCFLCLDHLPEGQKGILYRSDYLILCNPMPVFPSHFTISHLDHRAQTITEHIDIFLQLMADFGPGWTLLYNGPKCGASAPDHLHFQVAPSGRMPIENQVREEKRLSMVRKVDHALLYRGKDLGREVIILQGNEAMAVERAFNQFLNALKKVLLTEEEPMINIAGLYEERRWRLLIFPRVKHRPEAFFREGDARILVSPGAIDMGGLLITPLEKDFIRLDGAQVESIYREVSLEEKTVGRVIDLFGKEQSP